MLKLGSRIGLFAFEADEWPWIQHWTYDPEYRHFFRDQVAMRVDNMKAYASFDNGSTFMIKNIKSFELNGETIPVGTTIGMVMLYDMHLIPRNLKLSILVDKKFQSQAFCQEAIFIIADYVFNRLGYHKMIFEMMESNTDLAQLIEYGGFYKEATFKDEAFVDGEFKNVLRYCILRDEAVKKLKEFEEVIYASTSTRGSASGSR